MQKTRASLPVIIILPMVIAACALRFFQLLRQTDKSTGQIVAESSTVTVLVYIFIAALFFVSLAIGLRERSLAGAFDFEKESKTIRATSMLLSIGLFYDFVHQCYNCYHYLNNVSYVQYSYLLPLGISGIFALVSAGYFIAVSMSAGKTGVDFMSFKLFHFSPFIWAFAKLFSVLSSLFDFMKNVESCCEFIALGSVLGFFLCFVKAIDERNKSAGRSFLIFGLFSFAVCSVVSVPRIAMMIFVGFDSVSEVIFSAVTYLFLGIFILSLCVDLISRSKKQDL